MNSRFDFGCNVRAAGAAGAKAGCRRQRHQGAVGRDGARTDDQKAHINNILQRVYYCRQPARLHTLTGATLLTQHLSRMRRTGCKLASQPSTLRVKDGRSKHAQAVPQPGAQLGVAGAKRRCRRASLASARALSSHYLVFLWSVSAGAAAGRACGRGCTRLQAARHADGATPAQRWQQIAV